MPVFAVSSCSVFLFFFQAEDGIRDLYVTGVQTCALPISGKGKHTPLYVTAGWLFAELLLGIALVFLISSPGAQPAPAEIGRASCRERVESSGVGGVL